MGIRDQTTRLVNKTGQLISFAVDRGSCPLRDLPAGRSRSVSLSLILKHCRERGSAEWPIRVLINGRFHGMRLHPRHHILKMTRIVFRYKWGPDGTCVPIAEGVVENIVDRVFGCCCIKEEDVGNSDTVEAPLIMMDNSPRLSSFVLRSASWRKMIGNAFPAQRTRNIVRLWYGGRRTRIAIASIINSGKSWNTAVESRRRLYRMLSLRRRDAFNQFLLFVFAFVLVVSVHLLQMQLSL